MPTVVKYLLFQLPGWALAATILFALSHWLTLPRWGWAALFGTWLIKDAVVYPLVRTAYERTHTGAHRLVGGSGIARGRLDPRGYIHIRGELWRAVAEPESQPIDAGSPVTVLAARGLTLIVARDDRDPLRAGPKP